MRPRCYWAAIKHRRKNRRVNPRRRSGPSLFGQWYYFKPRAKFWMRVAIQAFLAKADLP